MKVSIVAIVISLVVATPLCSEQVQNSDDTTGQSHACPLSPNWESTDSDRNISDQKSIARLMRVWSEAVEAADLESIVSLVTEDCEFWTHGAEPLVGREALAAAFSPFLAQYRMRQEFDCQELVISGDLAFMRGTEINHLTPTNGDDPLVRRQRAFSVLRRSADGSWLFARGMTNLPPDP